MTDKQEMRVRSKAYKYYDEVIYENQDWNKFDIVRESFKAGVEYVLKNKYEFRKDTVDSLAEFLVMRGALNAFIENVLTQRGHKDLLYTLGDSINGAFTWGSTPQGYDYWYELHREYNELS